MQCVSFNNETTYRETSLHKEHKRGGEKQVEGVQAIVGLSDGFKGGTHTGLGCGVVVGGVAKDFVVKVRHGWCSDVL
jgi:hypothetical protein